METRTVERLSLRNLTAMDERFTPHDWALFVSVSAIWGASFLFIDIGLDAMPPGLITLMRVGLGAAALALVPRQRVTCGRSDLRRIVLLSVVWVAVPFTLFPIAEQHVSSSVAGLLNGGTPIFAATFAALIYHQRPSRAVLAGIGTGLVGVILISVPSIGEGSSQAFGVALVVIATVCYGFATTIVAPIQRAYGSINVMGTILALATIWTVPFGVWNLDEADFEWGPIVAVCVLGVVGTGFAYWIMGSLIARVGGTRASFITFVIPVVALFLGVTFRDDDVAALSIVGCGFVIAGALLAGRGGRRVTTPARPERAPAESR